jgi:hypothetical protein
MKFVKKLYALCLGMEGVDHKNNNENNNFMEHIATRNGKTIHSPSTIYMVLWLFFMSMVNNGYAYCLVL